MRDRSGVKILPPNENSLSIDALDGSPVFRVTYFFFMGGHSFRLSSPAALSQTICRLPDEDRLQDYEFVHFVVPVVSL